MPYPFSTLEVQLIRSSMATKSDEEIAEILEIPVELVREKINELTDGGADQRSADVRQYKLEQISIKERNRNPAKKRNRESAFEDDLKVFRGTRRAVEIRQREEFRQIERRRREDRKSFKTREVDFKEMVSVRVDKGAWLLVPKGANQKEAIALYEANKIIRQRNVWSKKVH